jgi:hypothetical protein
VTTGRRHARGIGFGATVAAVLVVVAICSPNTTARLLGTLTHSPLDVTAFGADPTDLVDDGAALQEALDSLVPGQTLRFPPGTYRHSTVLTVRVAGVHLAGDATLLATSETASAFAITADDVSVTGLTFGITATTGRHNEPAQHKIWVDGHRGLTMTDVTVTGSAAAGVFVQGAVSFRLTRVRVSDTRADGIHMTGGATDGEIDDAVVSRSGDDGIAVVSYSSDPGPCARIHVRSPRIAGTTWGRGISVVGGESVAYTDVDVSDTDAAAVYLGVEGDPFYTRATTGVSVGGGRIEKANRNRTIDHGAVLVLSGRRGVPVSDLTVAQLTISDTRATASHVVGVVATDGAAAPTDLRFEGLTVSGGPPVVYGGNVPASAYSVS